MAGGFGQDSLIDEQLMIECSQNVRFLQVHELCVLLYREPNYKKRCHGREISPSRKMEDVHIYFLYAIRLNSSEIGLDTK